MFRLLCIALYICQHITITHGQNAQTMAPVVSCVPATIQLQCPSNSVVIVRSAFHGVAQTASSCAYTPGDCTADAMSLITCGNDSTVCTPYITKKVLSQCENKYADYVRVEYDCVPISLNEIEKNYKICDPTGDITTDHGIITSPGYPTQFQTTTAECIRAIHVPDNKQIRLWLTDLYIASSLYDDCPTDHLFVVDNVRTYKLCGSKRLAYPDLCASTILIQYFVTTDYSVYRGMRLYFEIVDRVPTDVCSNATVTPIPMTTVSTTTSIYDTTTPVPIYVSLGIASPVISFQLCPGEKYPFQCPNDYVIVIRRNIYGFTQSDQCEKHQPSDCIVTNSLSAPCTRSCTFTFIGHQPTGECNNKPAAYQYIEYQCVPTTTELVSNVSCPTDGSSIPVQIDVNGRFQSYGYPHIKDMNCTYNLKTKPGYIMNFYALMISLNPDLTTCKGNKLILNDKYNNNATEFCAYEHNTFIFASCSDEVNLIYSVTDDTHYLFGVELYIETQQQPIDGRCGQPLTTTGASTVSTPPFITPTATPIQNQTYMAALPEVDHDICYTSLLSYPCPSDYTFMILDAYYGVKSHPSNKCGFVQGDCTQDALLILTQCQTDSFYCYIAFFNAFRLAQCSDQDADYLHIRSQCVPSKPTGSGTTVQLYNICDSGDIRDTHGIITSPNFPSFQTTSHECIRKLIKVQDRVLKIWINELSLESDAPSNLKDSMIHANDMNNQLEDLLESSPSLRDSCSTDFLQINTPHGIQRYCGQRKLALQPICANSVDLHYNATTPTSFYKGFKLYFEWIEKPMDVTCGGDPVPGSTTTPVDEPLPPWAQNLIVSPIMIAHVCLGTSTTIRCPRGTDYVLSIIQAFYGVTGSGQCDLTSGTHCYQPTSLDLSCTHSCYIEYIIPQTLSQCNSSQADYIEIYYECIPTVLPNNEEPIDVCSTTSTDTIATSSGIMTSPQYPSYTGTHTCSKRIQTLTSKLWMIFILDVHIDAPNDVGDCDSASLTVYDGDHEIKLCGSHKAEYLALTCSNVVELYYKSSHTSVNYRGFKIYFETIDIPLNWPCTPIGFSTTTAATTPLPPSTTTLLPPSLRIAAYGGTTNGTRQYCTIPFTYNGQVQSSCLKINPPSSTTGQNANEPWCSLTSNFDIDHQWGFCDLGVTDVTIYDICHGSYQLLQCPIGYVIDILTADYAAKPDGTTDSCAYDSNDCFQSDLPSKQNTCAGLTVCAIYHTIKPLASCQNRQSAYFHIDYTCVPKKIPEIIEYDMCNVSVIQNNTRRGFIKTPNFPLKPTQPNLDCTFNLRVDKPQQDIYLYIVEMRLNAPNGAGQPCVKERLLITADGVVNEICGLLFTNLLVYTCHQTVDLRFIRTSGADGYGFQLYFEFRDKPPLQLCPSLPTTTTVSTLSPTVPTTPTITPKPDYFPAPSKPIFRTLCFPETSSNIPGKDFQCPDNYVMVILRAFYGYNTVPICDHVDGDCIAEASVVEWSCAGKQSCIISFSSPVILPECSFQKAKYLLTEYQCLPTPSIISNTSDLCTAKIDSSSTYGILTSASYPIYTQTQCTNSTLSLTLTSNLVIYLYLLDMDISLETVASNNCSNDYLTISYQCRGQLFSTTLCGAQSTELLLSTCEPTDSIFVSYSLSNKNPQGGQRGFALLYHLLPPSGPITGASTKPTTAVQTTTDHIPGPGPVSTSIEIVTACSENSIILECNITDYALIIHKAELGVSKSDTCTYSPDDCFQDYTTSLNHCGGHRICHQFISPNIISECSSLIADYAYIEYQCVPTRAKLNLDICSAGENTIRVEGGAVISTINYTPTSQLCSVFLRSNKLLGSQEHKAFRIYILSLELPRRSTLRTQGALCNDDEPFIDIDDHEITPTRLCGYSHGRYVLETCSNIVQIRFNNTFVGSSTIYRGFQLYVESINNDQCRNKTTPPPPTDPFEIKNEILCATNSTPARVDFSCTLYHGLVFLQSNYFVRSDPNQCDVGQYVCHYPSDQPESQCSGSSSCTYTHVTSIEPELSHCDGKMADAIEFYYQCVPMRPFSDHVRYEFGDAPSTTSTLSGFIDTKHYPNSYGYILQSSSLTIEIPDNEKDKNYSIYLYVLDFSLRDASVLNSSAPTIQCIDELVYSDGNVTESLCGIIDQPLLQFYTTQKQLNLVLNISSTSSSHEANIWHGARLFFYIGNQSLPQPPSIVTTTSRPGGSTEGPSGSEPNHASLIVGLVISGLALLLIPLVGYVYYRRRVASLQSTPKVVYDPKKEIIDGTSTNEQTTQPTSIPRKSFSDKPLTVLSPYYDPNRSINNQEADDETDT